jgi:hypothetical protein
MKRQPRNRIFALTAGSVAFGIISACGGAGGGGLDVADGGIRGTGSSVGPVSGFGSVFVNGVRFNTAGAQIISDDGVTCEPDQNCTQPVEKGMILNINGEWRDDGEGTANLVEYDDTFRGPVSSVQSFTDSDGSIVRIEIGILGQTIVADKQTVFSQTSLAALSQGSFVRISGWPTASGRYRAAFVGITSASDQQGLGSSSVEIEGKANEVAENLNRFWINGTLIEYPETVGVFKDGLTEADLSTFTGAIEVEGEPAMIIGESGILADTIGKGESRRYEGETNADIEFVGPITDAYDPASRSLTSNGLTVIVPSDTELEDGLILSELTSGTLIQVEGVFDSEGRVVASEIGSREANAAISGPITVPLSEDRFEVGGVLVRITRFTLLSDDDNPISMTELQSGASVDVEGIERTSDGVVFVEALKIEREDDEDSEGFELEGRIAFMTQDPDYIEVLGIRLLDSPDVYDDVSRDDLLGIYQRTPLTVEVEYSSTAEVFVADEIELEENDND